MPLNRRVTRSRRRPTTVFVCGPVRQRKRLKVVYLTPKRLALMTTAIQTVLYSGAVDLVDETTKLVRQEGWAGRRVSKKLVVSWIEQVAPVRGRFCTIWKLEKARLGILQRRPVRRILKAPPKLEDPSQDPPEGGGEYSSWFRSMLSILSGVAFRMATNLFK